MRDGYVPNPAPFDPHTVPEPVLPEHPGWIDLYDFAWREAWNHVMLKPGAPQSPYMDEAFDPNVIWIWDTCFMAHFCKYAPQVFPGIESFDNFYAPLHEGVASPLAIQHPDNPPLFAWVELEYLRLTGDRKRIERILLEKQVLQKHFAFIESCRIDDLAPHSVCPLITQRVPEGFRWSGCPNGMDNTPRGRDDYDAILWVDLLAQQGLAAKSITALARIVGAEDLASEYEAHHRELGALCNRLYWEEEDGFYYDIFADAPHGHCKVPTIASYWPMLAGFCDAKQAQRLAHHAADPAWFGGAIPYPSLTRSDPDYDPRGCYWRGGVWVPTAYMASVALKQYGYHDIADTNAASLLTHMHRTYTEVEPHSIWEAYDPERPQPATDKFVGQIVRPDFCGWSALAPISMLIESVLGFHTIDALQKRVVWRKHQPGVHGIRRLRFGGIETDILAEADGIHVKSSHPYTLEINGMEHAIDAGTQILPA